MAKKIQTDYTKGGHEISNTAVPYYKQALTNMNDYNADPTQYIDKYLKYYDNTAQQSDFLTDYKRAMANATNRNYSATGGGYSSSGQRAYEDNQRYWNDEASRLSQANTSAAAQLAQNYFNNNLQSAGAYHNAYGLGKNYSDIEQWNNLVKQNNSFKNQLLDVGGKMHSQAGSVLSKIPNPWTQAIGAGLQQVGGVMQSQAIDPDSFMASEGWIKSGGGTTDNSHLFNAEGIAAGFGATAGMGGKNWLTALYGGGSPKGTKMSGDGGTFA